MKRVYLDYAASTPTDRRVVKAMQKAEKLAWANASSLHQEGEHAKKILEEARREIAYLLHCRSNEVIFTSGATEAANIAILGVLKNKKNTHVITSSIEHPSIIEATKSSRAEVTIVEPESNGIINPQKIATEIRENTVLVVLSSSNNEIGTIQPVREISKLKSAKNNFYLLVDASQSPLYEDVSVERLGADMMILSGTKIHGPKSSGVLVIKNTVSILPIMYGGDQEKGLRPGTENVAGAIGFAEALKVAALKREVESKRLVKLRNYTISKLLSEIPGSSLNGDMDRRLPNNINMCFPGQDSEFLVIKLDTMGFSVSAASACNNLNLENSSYVIEALGKKDLPAGRHGCANSSLRITLGRETKKSDLDKLIKTLKMII